MIAVMAIGSPTLKVVKGNLAELLKNE